jgi:hypothetical protein
VVGAILRWAYRRLDRRLRRVERRTWLVIGGVVVANVVIALVVTTVF